MPDIITVVDEPMRDEMIAVGFPADRLCLTGHPVLDEVQCWQAGPVMASRLYRRHRHGWSRMKPPATEALWHRTWLRRVIH